MTRPGRPKVTNKVRVNWRIKQDTKMAIEAKVVPGNRRMGSPGKVLDETFNQDKSK